MNKRIKTELDRFTEALTDEAMLRAAIYRLLEKMPNVRSLRNLHGRDEVGRDFTFETEGPFGQKSVHALVVKNWRISGSVSDSHGAREVLYQAQQALDTTLPRQSDAKKQKVTDVWVVSPYDCPPATTRSIEGQLRKSNGRSHFLCGRDLYDQFAQYYSEFLLYEMGTFGRLASEAVAQFSTDDPVGDALRLRGIFTVSRPEALRYIPPVLSKQINTFVLNLAFPDVAILDAAITKAELDSFIRTFAATSGSIDLLARRYDVNFNSAEGTAELAAMLKKNWDESTSERKSRKRQHIEPTTHGTHLRNSRNGIQLRGSAPLIKTAKTIIQDCHVAIAPAKEQIEGVNRCSSEFFTMPVERWTSLQCLKSYCFVENLSYEFPGIVNREGDRSAAPEFESSVFDKSEHDFLITGAAGTGKTSFCKWRAIEDLAKLKDGTGNVIAQYIPLYRLKGHDLSSFEDAFVQDHFLRELWLNKERGRWKFRFYLDGLDELADVTTQQEVLELALGIKRERSDISIVVTGRDYVATPTLQHFLRVSVQIFDDPRLNQFIEHWFSANEQAMATFNRELDKVPSLRDVMRVPLLATLVMRVYESTQSSLPENRVGLYDIFTQLLLGGWDFAKKVNRGSEFGSAVKTPLVTKLALNLQEDHKREFLETDFQQCVESVLPTQAPRANDILTEIRRDGLIVSEGKYMAFMHQSFQEYLAAKHLTEPGGDLARRAIRRYLSGDDWWGEVIRFYFALSPAPREHRRYIEKAASALVSHKQSVVIDPRVKRLLESVEMTYPGTTESGEKLKPKGRTR